MDKKIKRTKIVVDNVGRQPLPVIAREYVEKNYIHKEDLKNFIDFLEDTDIDLAETVYSEIRKQFLEEKNTNE